ncbi:hypothetical protein QF033_000636 [Bacillus pumilus]|uniref:hypothetical protein n=1 Tax=Bacillus pumilus TaxID=1408 RepID=UPI002780A00A|nr:hypothetical protein [Bacillus pumilus]MDQ0816058.1 hypothetical protein [Bacillus pumilus]
MSIEKAMELHNEFINILSVLKGKPFEVKETESILVITLKSDLSLELLEEMAKNINHFDYSLNPSSQPYNDAIEDIRLGIEKIDELSSITMHIEKEYVFEDIPDIDYIFFDLKYALSNLKNVNVQDSAYKLNIGTFNINNIETELIRFINISDSLGSRIPKIKINTDVIEYLKFYLSNNRNSAHTNWYNPYAFSIVLSEKNVDNLLSQLIKSEFYYTMLDCLSDKVDGDAYIIRGEKNINLAAEIEFSTSNYETFLDIYLFLISQKKYTEKYIIIKKVISLYMNDNEDISQFDLKLIDIWKTINHYYNHYIEDNIKEFFKTKDQLLKEAMSASKVIYEQTDKVTNSIIASILSILIIIVSTLFRSVSTISLTLVIVFLTIFLTFSIIFNFITKKSSLARCKLTTNQFNHFIQEVSLIPSDEVKQIRKTYLDEPFEELEKSLNTLKWALIIFNLIFLIFTCIYIGIETNFFTNINELITKISHFMTFLRCWVKL